MQEKDHLSFHRQNVELFLKSTTNYSFQSFFFSRKSFFFFKTQHRNKILPPLKQWHGKFVCLIMEFRCLCKMTVGLHFDFVWHPQWTGSQTLHGMKHFYYIAAVHALPVRLHSSHVIPPLQPHFLSSLQLSLNFRILLVDKHVCAISKIL